LETLARPVFHAGFDALVLAHYHSPVHRRESEGELVVLGDWIEQRSYARLEGGVFRLEDLRDGPAR
jgi:UDP-2,3-diacylglucosamine pyrophosphatase LpxH